MIIYIAMKSRLDSIIEFSLMSESANGAQHKLKPDNVNIKAILLPSMPGVDDQFIPKNLEDYEFEVLFESEKGVWSADLFNGNYLINVKSPGHAE